MAALSFSSDRFRRAALQHLPNLSQIRSRSHSSGASRPSSEIVAFRR